MPDPANVWNVTAAGAYVVPVPTSNVLVAVLVTGFCRLPMTKPDVRLTVPLAMSVLVPVVTAPEVRVSVEPTVAFTLPLSVTPAALLIVSRLNVVAVLPLTACALVPLNVTS